MRIVNGSVPHPHVFLMPRLPYPHLGLLRIVNTEGVTATMTDPSPIARRIMQAREKLGWNKSELAKRTSIDASYISRLESGEIQEPSPARLRELAEALSMPADVLLNGPAPANEDDDALLRRMIEARVGNRASADLIAVLIEKSRGRAPADVETIVSVVDVLLGKPSTDR